MTTRRSLGLLALAFACTRGTSPSAEAGRQAAPSSAAIPSSAVTPNAALASLCGAGDLPRLDESQLEPGQLLDRAQRGSVALIYDGTSARSVPGCTLPGAYTEVNGSGGGRFFSSNRVLLRTDEITPECKSATHLVVAYVAWRAPNDTSARNRLSAILAPLPCPSVSDPNPAAGCVGAGLTGPQRLARAQPLLEALRANGAMKQMVKDAFSAFALAPDDALTIGLLDRGASKDDALQAQAQWLLSQYAQVKTRSDAPIQFILRESRPAPPRHDVSLSTQGDSLDPLAKPVFMYCFSDHFTPSSPWTPATH